jgi:membrane protease YdiL (CAAX protease family)
MLENVPLRSPALFFLSRFLILAGMILFFMSVFYGVGMLLCKPLFGIDVLSDVSVLYTYTNNPEALQAVKFLQVMASIGMFIIPAWYFPKALQQNPKPFLQVDSGFTINDLLLGIGAMVISTPLIAWLVYINEGVKLPESMAALEQQLRASEELARQLTEAFIKADSFPVLLVNMFIVALLPAVCEELLFRGALQQFMLYCFKYKHFAVWFTAVVFSAFHGQFYGFLPRMVLGALLGYMFLYSGSLWVSVIVHFINNALALLANYYHWNEGATEIFKEGYVFPVYINILSFILSIGLVYLMKKNQHKKTWYNGE